MTNHIPVSGHQFFQFFRYFLKWKQLFRIVETYFSIFFTWLVQTDFRLSGSSIFGECYFTASRNHYWNKERTVLRERAQCCHWTTYFLANGNHFFLHFSETLARDSLFPVQQKCLFQRNPSFRLVETVLFCLEVFSSSENRHLSYIGSHSLKKDYVLTNAADSLASEYHFLLFFPTMVEIEKNGRKFPGQTPFFGGPCQFFFRLVENHCSRKSLFPPKGNGVQR